MMTVTGQPSNTPGSFSRERIDQLPRAPRVNQVDADELDEGLASMLGENVVNSLDNFKSRIDIKPEIMLILKLVIFRYSIFDPLLSSTPGARLQNLKLATTGSSHSPPRLKLFLYLLLHPPLFPSYLLNRLRTYALSQQWPDLPAHDYRRKMWRGIVRVENAARMWELAGWTWFLWDGLYPSLLMRVLGLRLIPSSPHVARLVSYEFMNRQLVWGSFTEFMMFAVPLLPSIPSFTPPSSLINPIKSLFTQPAIIDYTSIPLLPPSSSSMKAQESHSGPLANLPLSTCPICHLRYTSTPQPIASTSTGANIALPPVHVEAEHEDTSNGETRVFVPAQTDCWGGCRWCYYCIAGELAVHAEMMEEKALKGKRGIRKELEDEEEEKWSCLRCGGGVSQAWRVGPE